jgi:hypothetical protein
MLVSVEKSGLFGVEYWWDSCALLICSWVEEMLERDPEVVNRVNEEDGTNAFHAAAIKGQLSMIQWLTEHGSKDLLHAQDDAGNTVLIYAAYCGHTELVHFLIKSGLDIKCKDKEDRTALDWARERKHAACVSNNRARGYRIFLLIMMLWFVCKNCVVCCLLIRGYLHRLERSSRERECNCTFVESTNSLSMSTPELFSSLIPLLSQKKSRRLQNA